MTTRVQEQAHQEHAEEHGCCCWWCCVPRKSKIRHEDQKVEGTISIEDLEQDRAPTEERLGRDVPLNENIEICEHTGEEEGFGQYSATAEEMLRRKDTLHDKHEVSERNENEDRPDIMLATVEAWRREVICDTKSVKAVDEQTSSQCCVCVIGVPGAGKSTALHHAALSLEKEGFVIYVISGPKEFLKYYDKNKDQIFVVDDALGVYSVDQSKVALWQENNEIISKALGTTTKLLVSIRTQIFIYETIKDKDIVFLEKSEITDHIDFSDADYQLGIDDMRRMLTIYMEHKGINYDIIKDVIDKLWRYSEKELKEMKEEERQFYMSWYTPGSEFAQCFPLLCKVFVNTDNIQMNPREFFNNPFPALTKVFHNIKTDNKHQFCALVLCTMFDGTLTEDMISPLSDIPLNSVTKHDQKKMELRNYVMSTYKLKCPDDLEELQSALNSLTGVYISHIGDTYQISHALFHDIVTYLYNDPVFVFQYGTSAFIRDRVRLDKDSQQRDPYVIVYSDDTNIERLAHRLIKDLKSDIETGIEFIINNPNINDDRLISCLRRKLSDRDQTDKELINELFRECMLTVRYNRYTYKHGDVTQYKLIELCVQTGVDCNMDIDDDFPLPISVMTGSLQLTDLLLNNGADKRRIVEGSSILHWVCRFAKYNKLELIKLLTQHGGGECGVVEYITSDRDEISNASINDKDLRLERVLSDNSIEVLTCDKYEMKHYAKHCEGNLQLVRLLHDNILTFVDGKLRNILHYLSDDAEVTKYVFDLLDSHQLVQAVEQRDMHYQTPYLYVLNKVYPDKVDVEVSDKDREDMIQLYKGIPSSS